MSLTSYRAAPPRGNGVLGGVLRGVSGAPRITSGAWFGGGQSRGRGGSVFGAGCWLWGFGEPGGDLLFRRLSGSTIGAEGFHGRVRDGIGCLAPRCGHQAGQAPLALLLWAFPPLGISAPGASPPRRRVVGFVAGGARLPPRRLRALDAPRRRRLMHPGGALWGMAGGICEGGGGSIWRAAMGGRLMGACRCTPAVFRLSPAGAGESIRIGRVRAISTGRLRGLLRFHFRPIDVVVFHGSRRDLVLRRVSRLDAFSGYPVRT